MSVLVQIARSVPKSVDAVGVPVATSGAVARSLGLGRAALAAHGFEGKLGQVLVVPQPSGPAYIAIGVGAPGSLTPSSLRTAAAALVRAAGKRAVIATSLADLDDVASLQAGQVVVEGAMLAAYRFAAIVKEPVTRSLTELVLVVGDSRAKAVAAGAERGQVIAEAATLARDLANTPPSNLNARHIADMAVQISALTGLGVEVFNRDQLLAMGCGGVVGVNRGSVEPPRVVKLTYMPRNPSGHLAMVGKGITFDSGGLSIKTTDGMGTMKMDMSGAAAVLSAMSALKALKCKSRVTAYLMCTDNMPSGSAV
ncbi:MAG: M17 family peptidase N-terminal domain-containing protein, partial [Actinomycetota bacterium]